MFDRKKSLYDKSTFQFYISCNHILQFPILCILKDLIPAFPVRVRQICPARGGHASTWKD